MLHAYLYGYGAMQGAGGGLGFTRGVAIGDSLTKGNSSPVNGGSYPTYMPSPIELVKRGVSGRTLSDMATAFATEVVAAGCGPNLVPNSEFYSDTPGTQPADWTEHDAGGVATAEIGANNVYYLKLLNGDATVARVYPTLTNVEVGKDYVWSFRWEPVASAITSSYFVGSVVSGAGFDDVLPAKGFIGGFESRVGTASATTQYFQIYGNGVLNDFTAFTEAEVRENLSAEFVVIFGGINDVSGGDTAANMITNRDSMISDAITAGIHPIICTITPWDAASGAEQAVIDAYNSDTLLLSNTVINAYSAFEDPSNADKLNPAYDVGDGLHFNSTGQSYLADLIAAIL